MKKNQRSVREVLQVIVMWTTAAALLVACTGFVVADLFRSRRALESDLSTLAEIIGSNSTAALMFGDPVAAHDILGGLSARHSIVAARLVDKNGRVFAVYPTSGPAPAKLGIIEVHRPIAFRGETLGTIYIASDLRDLITGARHYTLVALLIILTTLLLAMGLSSKMQRRLSDPILALARFADRIRREKDYSLRTPDPTRSVQEIDFLTSAFDEMLAAIEQRDDHLEDEVQARTSELARARDEAERLGHYQQTVLNTAGEGIFGLDANGVATFINVSAARMLSYSVDELLGRRLHDVIHDAELAARPLAECRVCSAVLEPSLRTGAKVFFVARNGRSFAVEYTTSRMHGNAGESGVVVTFRDVTDRLAIERMKDEFVSTVSHELRTPLTSIHGSLGLVASGLAGELPPRVKRMLDIAVANTDRLGRLINDILDLEKMSSGRIDLQRTLASTKGLIDDAVNVVQAVADRADIRITRSDVDAVVWVDRDRIVQTLTNLLGNAIKFSAPGAAVHVSGSMSGESFMFAVSDTGRGIPADKLETVFERFKQVDASDSRDKGGTGLGLAICRSIIGAHGGRIWVDSVEGSGSTFQFTIPIDATLADERKPNVVVLSAEPSARETQLVQAIERSGPSVRVARSVDDARTQPAPWAFVISNNTGDVGYALQRIAPVIHAPSEVGDVGSAIHAAIHSPWVLVVEDDPDLSGVLAASLEACDLRTVVAQTGSMAMQRCEGAPPRAIILDVGLPDVDGFAVLEWMRRQQRLRDVPLIVYSARELGGDEASRLLLGPTQFLVKGRAPVSAVVDAVLNIIDEAKEALGAA